MYTCGTCTFVTQFLTQFLVLRLLKGSLSLLFGDLLPMPSHLFSRLNCVAFIGDVVAIEYRACSMPGYLHGSLLGDAGANHVPDCSAPHVMKDQISSERPDFRRAFSKPVRK